MKKYLIALDPDLDKSGIAIFDKLTNEYIDITSEHLWDLFQRLIDINSTSDVLVLLEAGHLNKNTWHDGGRGASKNMGKGQAIGILLERFMIEKKIKHKLLKPKGYSKFFNDVKFFKLQTNWQKQTNKDARAAAAIVFLNK